MRVIGIKIDNYKSFSNVQNILRFDSEDTLALIGKNESGKSNTLLALKDLLFFESNSNLKIFNDKNKTLNEEVKVSVEVEFNKEDLNNYNNIMTNYVSRFVFEKIDNTIFLNFEGCISEILRNDKKLTDLSLEIIKFSPKYQQENNAKNFKERVKNFYSNYIGQINIDLYFSINSEQKEKYVQFREILDKYYEQFRAVLPKMIYFSNDMVLKNRYTYENITKKEDIIGLELLLEALNFSLEDLKSWLTTTDISAKQKYSIRFQNELNKFNKDFQKYYKTNKIELLVNVDSRVIEFSIKDDLETDGTSVTSFSERSDGLKWYISMFIKIYASKQKYRYSLILLDEPGNSLHVIAQKKLLELLMKKQNFQIIYTTHSPYMIDVKHLENIRLITKGKFTSITNGINNSKQRGKKSFKETITPILEAIGLSLNYNFGPSQQKINLVVEGISDYFYIKTMLNFLKVDEQDIPNIIPCIGATNESNIISILIGWGYDFKCLLDNDKEGVDTFKEIRKHLDNCEEKIFFISDNYGNTIESLLSSNIKELIDSGSKTLNAKKFIMMVEKNQLQIDKETTENFIQLFKKINILK